MTSVFSGLKQAQSTGGGNYFNPGVYRAKLQRAALIGSTNPSTVGHQIFVTEWAIVRVITHKYPTSDEQAKVTGVRFPASNEVGEAVSHILNLTKNAATAMGNLKNLIAAVEPSVLDFLSAENRQELEAEAQDPDFDDYEWIADKMVEGEGTRFAGLEVEVHATGIRTRAGNPFTKVVYRDVGGEVAMEDAAAATGGVIMENGASPTN